MSLLRLCFRLNLEVTELRRHSPKDFLEPFPTFIDEGLIKAGSIIELPEWKRTFKNQQIMSVRSVDNIGIQLADFAAFCIARSQWIMAKTDPGKLLTQADQHIFSCVSKFNAPNLAWFKVDPKNFSRDTYEFVLMRDRKNRGLKFKPT
tara:strand:- start:154 stop:597 length:444 start_codon:yes stop_codon:yes gene_type:complete